MSLGSGVIPAWLFAPKKLCFICKHGWYSHREDVGCIGPSNDKDDPPSFWKGTCKAGCKKFIKDNLEYLAYKHEQKKNK